MSEQQIQTVGELLHHVRNAQRWAGKKNPNLPVLKACEAGITNLAQRCADLEAKLATLESRD